LRLDTFDREVPTTEVRFSGTPDYESSTVSRRRNLPDRLSEHVDYYDVQVDYMFTNRLKNGRGSETATDRQS
jgi:hypothetical protein